MSYKVGEKVVYPTHGVGVIDQITHNQVSGRAEQFYLVRILGNGLRVTVPCANSGAVGLRPLIRSRDVPRVLSRLQNSKPDSHRDWKSRFKQNSERMRTGSAFETADVLCSLAGLSRTKVLSFREKKMLESARSILIKELAAVRGVNETTIEAEVQKRLGKSRLRPPAGDGSEV